MTKERTITLDDVIAASGVHPYIFRFACWYGFTLGSSDLSFNEQAARLKCLYPEMEHDDVVLFLGESLSEEINDWFVETFPPVK